ncbi:YidB family protein (plasmid) [Rhizobium sp. 32-5/1]|uniref:YidB family protein n=1 Tax=Rhizobium sp. 32-5/1 TaxID=3019602 RepID=UPI00240E3CE0|nr:YidB family protein [Rhizobium sp. 32-5/1]WEZ85525.1 YidB family protein [Rhizobium sp. 32-5/1]
MASSALKALLGVLAVAGFQNRDKIGELLRGLQNPQGNGVPGQQQGGLGGLLGGLTGGGAGGLGGLGGLLGGASAGGVLGGGLGDLLKQFQQNGHGETAKSWVETGPNAQINDRQLSEALGPEVLDDLSARTGLSPDEILSRLSRDLPKAVDELTPDGTIPSAHDHGPDNGGMQSVPSVKPLIV